MVQQSERADRAPLPSMVSQGKSVPESEQKPDSGWREGKGGFPQPPRRQQQSKSQDPVKAQATSEHLQQLASMGRYLATNSAQGLPTKDGKSAKNGKRPREHSVELPPRPSVRYQGDQARSQVKAPEGPSKSMSMKVKPATSQKMQSDHRKQTPRKATPVLYGLRLLILGVGVCVIVGTLLSVLDPTKRITAEPSQIGTVQETQQKQANGAAVVQGSTLKLDQEIMPLKTVVQQLVAKNANLIPGVFFVDLDTGGYIDWNGSSIFAAASMIKFPVLVAFFQDVDAGKIRLDEKLTLKQELIGGGSGDMQYKTPGTKFTALETATKMITISDNTATNMLIARLGGMAALNQRFQSWGLQTTEIRNLLPDLPGTNITSPRDLADLMALVNQGGLISLKSRDRLLDIMRRTVTATLLPRGLGEGATIAHKTGDIGTLVGDVGLVDMPNGKRYIAVAMVKRPHNDSRAQELIRQVSRAAYQQFNKPAVSEIMPTAPFTTNSVER